MKGRGMKLALIRHAEAVVLGEQGTTADFDRMLTELGRRQAAALAQALQRIGCIPGLILTSPLVRAWQTAEILAETLTPGKEPMHCDPPRHRRATLQEAHPAKWLGSATMSLFSSATCLI